MENTMGTTNTVVKEKTTKKVTNQQRMVQIIVTQLPM